MSRRRGNWPRPPSTRAKRSPTGPARPPVLAGCYIRLAEKSDPGGAPKRWQKARQYLEQADQAGVPDRERPRLTYRLAKVDFCTGSPAQRSSNAWRNPSRPPTTAPRATTC